jgi:chromosome segregation ATPase
MDSDTQETLRHDDATNKILEAINALRTETSERLDSIDRGLFKLEREVGEMKDSQLTFDVRLDRLESMAHEALQVAYGVRADVKVLRAEVTAWAADVTDLQRKVA